ncbi:MAG: AAA family ATPase [Candidatus Harrisonbacteria bacterium]|nr:AAA family ATPase [Candidatus Harrisonbacteria bacterium]
MNREQKDKLYQFVRDQIAQGSFRTHAYVFNDQGEQNPRRSMFLRMQKYISDFTSGDASVRWLVMPGLRGSGKTTLLAQLYHDTSVPAERKLFLSVDQITQTFGASLSEIIQTYEEAVGGSFERLEEPIFLFLDEVQYDSRWAGFLKTVYDRTRKVFIIATGSSALMLNVNADVARRAISEKLYPMSFTEFMKIKHGKYEERGLAKQLRKALLESTSAKEAYDQLKGCEPLVKKYWLNVARDEMTHYINYGTLPYMVALKNEALVYDQIKKSLERVVSVDIPQIGRFRPDIASKFPMLLYAIADSEQLSLNSLSRVMEIGRPTLMHMLNVLEQTETVMRVYPHGSHRSQVRKPSKYLFTSPAFRAMYFKFVGSTQRKEVYEGKLLEDIVGLYLGRVCEQRSIYLTYDSAAGGADFIVRDNSETIAVEVGRGQKNYKQVLRTAKKVNAKYGLVISSSELGLDAKQSAVSMPFEFFLLA